MSGYYKDRMGPFSFVFREGLEWTDIDWVDNGECLDLIEKVSTTVLIKRVSQIVSLQHMIISLLLGRYLCRHATLLPWSCVTILKTASKETYT